MSSKPKTGAELWEGVEGLDDDLLDPNMPEDLVIDEIKGMGLDPDDLKAKGTKIAAQLRDRERLSWQVRALESRRRLEARAACAQQVLPGMDRPALLARLDELRAADSTLGGAIKMAARKRKPEESTDEELGALIEEMEMLRAMQDDEE